MFRVQHPKLEVLLKLKPLPWTDRHGKCPKNGQWPEALHEINSALALQGGGGGGGEWGGGEYFEDIETDRHTKKHNICTWEIMSCCSPNKQTSKKKKKNRSRSTACSICFLRLSVDLFPRICCKSSQLWTNATRWSQRNDFPRPDCKNTPNMQIINWNNWNCTTSRRALSQESRNIDRTLNMSKYQNKIPLPFLLSIHVTKYARADHTSWWPMHSLRYWWRGLSQC